MEQEPQIIKYFNIEPKNMDKRVRVFKHQLLEDIITGAIKEDEITFGMDVVKRHWRSLYTKLINENRDEEGQEITIYAQQALQTLRGKLEEVRNHDTTSNRK